MSATALAPPVPLGALLRSPGFAGLFIASLVGRLPTAALSLVLILRTRELTGSYAAGGAVVAGQAIALAVSGPMLGRLVDRWGQTRVLAPSTALASLAVAATAALPVGVSLAAPLACAVVAGAAMPPLAPCLRTLIPVVLPRPDRAHAAFALDAAGLEVTYILGPLVIGGGIATWSPSAAVLACAVLLAAGTTAFMAHPASRTWRSDGDRSRGAAGALRAPGVRVLVATFVLIGIAFGAVPLGVPAVTEAAGARAAAGPLLALWGLGSLFTGIAVARASAPAHPVRRLCLSLTGLAAGHALLAPAAFELPLLGAALLVAGLAISPTMAVAYGLAGRLAPPGTTTETYTWLGTGMAAGVASGSAIAGVVVDNADPALAFALAAVALTVTAALTTAGRRRLTPAG